LLLLSLGYLIAHTNLFDVYDERLKQGMDLYDLKHFWIDPTFHTECGKYLDENVPKEQKVSHSAILSLYNLAHKRIA
jgi:hypothetical protein